MNNLETAVDVLSRHREGRHWTDEAVAADLMERLRLVPGGEVGAGADAMALVEVATKAAAAQAAVQAPVVVEEPAAVAEPVAEPEPVAETPAEPEAPQ